MNTDTFYHLFNHANGDDNLFKSKENYRYFMKRYTEYICSVADTYAFCLMPNHFHFLIKIKEEDDLRKYFKSLNKDLTGFENLSGLINKRFSNFFNAYAKAFNLMYHRKGSLFNRPFKTKEVSTDAYLAKLIHYIHANPVHHGFISNLEKWPYNSYCTLISNKRTMLKRNDVFELFDGREEFIKQHQREIDSRIIFNFD